MSKNCFQGSDISTSGIWQHLKWKSYIFLLKLHVRNIFKDRGRRVQFWALHTHWKLGYDLKMRSRITGYILSEYSIYSPSFHYASLYWGPSMCKASYPVLRGVPVKEAEVEVQEYPYTMTCFIQKWFIAFGNHKGRIHPSLWIIQLLMPVHWGVECNQLLHISIGSPKAKTLRCSQGMI